MKGHFNQPGSVATTPSDIVIVGAGIAGLTTAFRLLELAAQDGRTPPSITILEGASVPGGRAKSITHAGSVINTGGQWLHDSSGNPFHTWLKTRWPDLAFNVDGMEQDVTFMNGIEQAFGFYEDMSNLFYEAYERIKAVDPARDPDLAVVAAAVDSPHAAVFAACIAQNWLATSDPTQISCDELYGDSYGPGGPQAVAGMSPIIDRMADDLRAAGVSIEMNAPVAKIAHDLSGVTLHTGDGRVFTAKSTVVTVSAGVLQRGLIDFQPALGTEVKNYLDGISMGRMTKIFVPLAEEFFTRNNISENSFATAIDGDLQIFCHARSMGVPGITIFTGGALAEDMERRTPAAVCAFADDFFRRLGAPYDGCAAFASGPVHITGWNADPLTCGAYSNLKPGAGRADPLTDGKITFAGEAFITRDENGKNPAGTMSAAWSSGRRAAADLWAQLRPSAPLSRPDPGFQPS